MALQQQLQGLMSFPVTAFGDDGEVDLPRCKEHFERQQATAAAGLFVACGTGEMFSLNHDEHHRVIRAAVDVVAGAKPVIAGVGYGCAIAIEMARSAEAAGADGVLALPPYLLKADQDGLYEHYRQIAAAIDIGVIVYQRDTAIFAPTTVARLAEIPNVIGFKDGHGDLDLLQRIRLATGPNLALMNGMPTAELTAIPYRACGVNSYSSAILNFLPDVAQRFFQAVEDDDAATTDRLLTEIVIPFVELRDRRAGYAVALVKAGVNAVGFSAGKVRPPLVHPREQDYEDLEELISAAQHVMVGS